MNEKKTRTVQIDLFHEYKTDKNWNTYACMLFDPNRNVANLVFGSFCCHFWLFWFPSGRSLSPSLNQSWSEPSFIFRKLTSIIRDF